MHGSRVDGFDYRIVSARCQAFDYFYYSRPLAKSAQADRCHGTRLFSLFRLG